MSSGFGLSWDLGTSSQLSPWGIRVMSSITNGTGRKIGRSCHYQAVSSECCLLREPSTLCFGSLLQWGLGAPTTQHLILQTQAMEPLVFYQD